MEEDDKKHLLTLISNYKKRHEEIKHEMLKNIDASKILEVEYKNLEVELYEIEDKYINVMKLINK